MLHQASSPFLLKFHEKMFVLVDIVSVGILSAPYTGYNELHSVSQCQLSHTVAGHGGGYTGGWEVCALCDAWHGE